MYKYTLFSWLILGGILYAHKQNPTWSVIGGGPAGIITVSTLIDYGVPTDHIHWIDPAFSVGRLGAYYTNVPANTCVADFLDFLTASTTFIAAAQNSIQELNMTYPHASFQPLRVITRPLQCITNTLCNHVITHQTRATEFNLEHDGWHIQCEDGTALTSTYVVLAPGARPRLLNYDVDDVIPLDIALDKYRLQNEVTSDDTVCVVGSSHSAVLLLKYLSEIGVKRIINLYKHPLVYAYQDGEYQVHPSSGLKGVAAAWAYHVLEQDPPHNLIRAYNDEAARQYYLPQCTKIIYAAGYERNPLPTLTGAACISYDANTGIIAPGMFGIGIAFPEKQMDSVGNQEYLVGVNSFLSYAQRMVPYWMTYPEPSEQSKECDASLIIEAW